MMLFTTRVVATGRNLVSTTRSLDINENNKGRFKKKKIIDQEHHRGHHQDHNQLIIN